MISTIIPTAEQLGAARQALWHQNGEALLTFENLRSWINVAGLVLFIPRASQLPAPAPSLVEAVLGTANSEPSMAETEQAKSLLGRLVAEGIAVPLNLLGTPGETPDFVVSAPVFSYIFTLRGDKAWKQAPATSGASKVSPLAAATFDVLSKQTAISAYDLVTELGKEVTESAVLRALNELWAHLRVIPVNQPDGPATLWELTTARFTKHIKAGANAGQPSALSALISLYLGSSTLATEEEIETFLSPLAARSRIRDVVHALMGARELETLVVEGRTLLHVSGSLPAFASASVDLQESGDVHGKPAEVIQVEAGGVLAETDAPRIKKFVAKPRKLGTGFPSDYGRKFSGGPMDPGDRKSNGERRPFDRSAAAGRTRPTFGKPAFNKPWDEERAARPAAESAKGGESLAPAVSENRAPRPAKRVYESRPGRERPDGRQPFGKKPPFDATLSVGNKTGFGTRAGSSYRAGSGDKPGYGARPDYVSRKPSRGDDSLSPRRDSSPRAAGQRDDRSADARGPRKTFSKPKTFGREREGSAGKPAFGDAKSPRREFSGRPGANRPARSPDRPGRSSSDGSGRPAERASAGFKPRTPGSFSPKPVGTYGDRSGAPRDRGNSGERSTSRPVYRKFDAPRGDRPARAFDSDRSSLGQSSSDRSAGASDRPARPLGRPASGENKRPFGRPSPSSFGAKRPGSSTGKPSGTFAKFADGKNPFRKPGKPGGKGGSFKGKKTSFDQPAYRERKPKAGE